MTMADPTLFLVGLKIIHVGQRDEFQSLAESGARWVRPVSSRSAVRLVSCRAVEPAGADQRLFELLQRTGLNE
ncbi:MAG: hypothetical protein R3F36_01760 [Candidatus Competibacteraceae bacterium]